MAIYLFFPVEMYSAIPALEGFLFQKMTGYMPEKDALIFFIFVPQMRHSDLLFGFFKMSS